MKQIFQITRESGVPLFGCIAFGIIDRGTSLIQIRPTSVCNLNCAFCSTDGGPFSRFHGTDYVVDKDYLVDNIKEVVKLKGDGVEANIDSVGEPTTYKHLTELISDISRIKGISRISMQTNGTLLNKDKIINLEKAGLNEINLSIHSLEPELAKTLMGDKSYDIKKVIDIAREIAKTRIVLLIAPVYLPGVNDDEIPAIIELAKEINAKIGIQKYEVYKYGRKFKAAKHENWWKFYKRLVELEKKHNTKLKISAKDFKIEKKPSIPEVFRKNESPYVVVKAPGWINGQMIAVTRDRCISINNCNSKIGDKIKIKILETKNNIYIGEMKN
ncbi:radical SAM protein [Candidatus Woesearchaeota archaeon]|nr:radical SAM protein [Candidatus Woesearchaeota archaeon]